MNAQPKHPKDQSPVWVRDLMRKASKTVDNQRALAEILGVKQPNIGAYIHGKQTPTINVIERLLAHMGGDISRALPGYELPVKEQSVVYEDSDQYSLTERSPNQIFISGQVAAGKVTFAGEDQHFKTFDALWGESRYWGLTTGDIVFVEVHGESMSPDYKPGEVLACRMPTDPLSLPNGTPCIFQEGDEDGLTFKVLRITDSGDIIGQPVNPDYPFVVFKRKSVRISLVVLGKVQLEKRTANNAIVEAKPRRKTEKKQK